MRLSGAMSQTSSRDIIQTTLGLLVLGCLAISSYLVLKPFLAALVWAGMIVVATWPLMLKLQALLFGKRWLAVTIVTIGLLFLLIIPLWLAISSIVTNSSDISEFAESLRSSGIPEPPAKLKDVPLIGQRLTAKWQEFSNTDRGELGAKISPYIGRALGWLISSIGDLSLLFLHFILTVIISAILFVSGESVSAGLKQFANRLAGERGEGIVVLSGQAIRAVALGIVVTSLLQAAMAALGFLVTSTPYPLLLTVILFLLCVIQIGAWAVLLPVVGWLFYSGSSGMASAMLVWSILILVMDNVLRPLLIKKGADLPLLLIFAGVIGGLLAFGILGLFIGPVALAVTYTLLKAWINPEEHLVRLR